MRLANWINLCLYSDHSREAPAFKDNVIWDKHDTRAAWVWGDEDEDENEKDNDGAGDLALAPIGKFSPCQSWSRVVPKDTRRGDCPGEGMAYALMTADGGRDQL